MVKLLGLGDNVCDVYLHTGTMYPGGQALNVAVYARQLGAQSDFMGVFGRDEVARHIQNTLDELQVGYSHCRSYDGENGFARVTLEDGDRVFRGSNKGGVLQQHPIHLEPADLEYAAGFDLIHTSNNAFTDQLLPTLARLPGFLSYDFSTRWNEPDRLERVCPYVDFAFLSCGDLDEAQTGQLCRTLYEKGCRMITATRGSKGALVFDGLQFFSQPPDLVQAVDTMGAGDSFASALLVSLLLALECTGRPGWEDPSFRREVLPVALKNAAAFAAKTCLTHGAFGHGIAVPPQLRPRFYEEVTP